MTIFIGGGFLGLEVAAYAVQHSQAVVLELAPQILSRVLSKETANALSNHHTAEGIELRCGVEIDRIEGTGGRVSTVVLASGERIAADRIVVSIGATARDELAREARIDCGNGIVVDAGLKTSDDNIFAIGDCANFPSVFAEAYMRVESVQNATDQARYVAAVIAGRSSSRYQSVPWFWSQQGEHKLQIAGIAMPDDKARWLRALIADDSLSSVCATVE